MSRSPQNSRRTAPKNRTGPPWLTIVVVAASVAMVYAIAAPGYHAYRAKLKPTATPSQPSTHWRDVLQNIKTITSPMGDTLERLPTAQQSDYPALAARLQPAIDALAALQTPACLQTVRLPALESLRATHNALLIAASSPTGINTPSAVRELTASSLHIKLSREAVLANLCEQ